MKRLFWKLYFYKYLRLRWGEEEISTKLCVYVYAYVCNISLKKSPT